VITVSGPIYERATVVMRDELITAIGRDATPPPGARSRAAPVELEPMMLAHRSLHPGR